MFLYSVFYVLRNELSEINCSRDQLTSITRMQKDSFLFSDGTFLFSLILGLWDLERIYLCTRRPK